MYFQKFNVINKNYSHQYAQNIQDANSKGNTIYKGYRDNGLLEKAFNFIIPVYENMPASAYPRPLSK